MTRPSIVVAVVVAAMTFAVAATSAAAWNADETGATVALIVAVVAMGFGGSALAGYIIWLRGRMNRRMILLLGQP